MDESCYIILRCTEWFFKHTLLQSVYRSGVKYLFMYLFYFIMYSGKCILEDHTESSWLYNSGLDSGSQTNTPSPAHFVCLPHLSHLIQLISSLVQTARPGGASQFLFVHHPFLSSHLSSTPSGCEERVHGKKRDGPHCRT